MINSRKILLLLGLSIVLLIFNGCASELSQESISEITINFESVAHKRTDFSLRMYKALAATHNEVFYEIEESCVSDEDSAKAVILRVDNDIKKINDFLTGLELDAPTVIITSKSNLDGEELQFSYHHDNTITTTIDFIASKEYLYALIGAMLNNDIPWINHGLAGQFDSNKINNDEIRAYLSYNIDLVDFFGARYHKTVPGNNWDKAAAITKAFVDYYINAYGKTSFIDYIKGDEKSDLVQEKNEWLEYLGVQKSYSNDTNIIFQNFRFSEHPHHDFVIDSKYASYRIKMNVGEQYVLSSVDRLKYFLTKNILGMQEVKTYLSNNISDKDLIYYDVIPIYDINEEIGQLGGYTDAANKVITIHGPLPEAIHIHEYVHTVSPINKNVDRTLYHEYKYFVEGAACYVTSSVNNEYSCNVTNFDTYEQYNLYQVLTKNIIERDADGTQIFENVTEINKAFERSYLDYYMSHAADFTEFSDFSMKKYCDAYSYARFVMMDKKPTLESDFKYAVYESFVGYLAEEYSLEQVIQAIDNYDIQAIFGKSFSELIGEWKEYLYKSQS